MQTTVDTSLSLTDRHKLITAGREFIKIQLSHALPTIGILPSNLYAWMKDPTKGSVSPAKQGATMKLFGLLPTGRLTDDEMHAWHLSPESAEHVPVFLEYETDISDVEIRPAVTTAKTRVREAEPREIFIGAYVTWRAPRASGKKVECRLIVTAPLWLQEELVAFLVSVFGKKSRAKPKVLAKLDITPQACEMVWRHLIRSRAPDGSRITVPPSMGLLPFDQDIIGKHIQSAEPPESVLNDMTARFKALSHKFYTQQGKKLPPLDKSLIRRAEAVLSASER